MMARQLKPCGTEAAYHRHMRRGEPADIRCRAASSTERQVRKRTMPGKRAALGRAKQQAALLELIHVLAEAMGVYPGPPLPGPNRAREAAARAR